MSPRTATTYIINIGDRAVDMTGNGRAVVSGQVQPPDFTHNGIRQFGTLVAFAAVAEWLTGAFLFWRRRAGSATFEGIVFVVFVVTPAQMVRVAASWIVAVMQSKRLVSRRWTVGKETSDAGGEKMSASRFSGCDCEVAVTFVLNWAYPRPTLIGATALNLPPEPADVFFRQIEHALRFSYKKLMLSSV